MQIVGAIDADTAVVTLTHVDYRSGAILDMAGITEAAARGPRAHRLGPVAQCRARSSCNSTPLAATWPSAADTNI
jgi:hypothetical protein